MAEEKEEGERECEVWSEKGGRGREEEKGRRKQERRECCVRCTEVERAMADEEPKPEEEQKAKRKSFRKFSYRGVELTQLLDLKTDELVELFHARARRR